MRRTINKKYLYIILSIVCISVLTLTLAYATLSVSLNIIGNAEVSSANWDIYLNNPIVKNGSVTSDVPFINSPTELEFSTTLNMPGDYYEFTVEVVNDGSIDAMIEDIVLISNITTDQLKYINVLVEYENGTQLTKKQILKASSFIKLKGRVEYRKDISASDLPTTSSTIDMAVKLIYTQADSTAIENAGSGSGNSTKLNIVSGDLDTIGSEVCIGDECFYVVASDDEYVGLFTKYNLYVGHVLYRFNADDSADYEVLSDATGIQNPIAKAFDVENGDYKFPMYGGYPFSNDDRSYDSSLIKNVVDDYTYYISSLGYIPLVGMLIDVETLNELGCNVSEYTCLNSEYEWLYSSSYWTMSPVTSDTSNMYVVTLLGGIMQVHYGVSYAWGVRPIIYFEKSELMK